MDNKNLYTYCYVAESTDVGCKRKANEDFLDHFVCENGLVSVVCDGRSRRRCGCFTCGC